MVQVDETGKGRDRDDYVYLVVSAIIIVLLSLPVAAAMIGLAVRVFLWGAGIRPLY